VATASHCDALNTNQLEGSSGSTFDFQAELNSLSNPLHQGVEILGLRVAAAEFGDVGYIVALAVPLDNHGKFALGFHQSSLAPLTLACGK